MNTIGICFYGLLYITILIDYTIPSFFILFCSSVWILYIFAIKKKKLEIPSFLILFGVNV